MNATVVKERKKVNGPSYEGFCRFPYIIHVTEPFGCTFCEIVSTKKRAIPSALIRDCNVIVTLLLSREKMMKMYMLITMLVAMVLVNISLASDDNLNDLGGCIYWLPCWLLWY